MLKGIKSILQDEIIQTILFLLAVMLVLFVVVAAAAGFVSLMGSLLPSVEAICLDSDTPRRYIPESDTCQEYEDGVWAEIDTRIRYNEPGEGKR